MVIVNEQTRTATMDIDVTGVVPTGVVLKASGMAGVM